MTTKQTRQLARDSLSSPNGAGSLRIAPPGRRIQVPLLLGGLLLAFVSILAFLVIYSGAAARESVLVLANPVGRGQSVVAEDFRRVELAADTDIPTVDSEQLASLVGRIAVADLAVGTLASPGLFVERLAVAPGEGVVGLSLSPGEYPTRQLSVGDKVNVVSVGTEPGQIVASNAEVFDAVDLTTQGTRFISLRLPKRAASEVAEAAEGKVRLVLVGDVP